MRFFQYERSRSVLPGTLVESTVRAGAQVASGKALALGLISSRVGILIEEALKAMVVTKLKLASVVVLVGTIGAAAVLAQQGPRRQAIGPIDPAREGGSAGSRRPAGGDSGQAVAGTPAYIRESRALIITRLEEEVGEAKARLDRTFKKFQSADHPAVVRARETLDALVQRLDQIDRVLVDVVETYPTMVDFSGGPDRSDARAERELGYQQTIEELSHRIDEMKATQQDLRAKTQLTSLEATAQSRGRKGKVGTGTRTSHRDTERRVKIVRIALRATARSQSRTTKISPQTRRVARRKKVRAGKNRRSAITPAGRPSRASKSGSAVTDTVL